MKSRWLDLSWLLVVGLGSSLWCLAAAWELGATYDEPTYLEHGLHFWRTGSHRQLMRLGTMPLPVDLQTLPLALAERWRGEPWDWDRDCERILPWMRHGNLVFWWLLLAGGMTLGRELAGPWGGRIAATALAFEPNLLAHASLATTDISVSATLLWFVIMYRRGRGGDWRARIGWPGLWMGLALLCKASALVFGPLAMLAVELSRYFSEPQADWRGQIRSWWHDGLRIGLIAAIIVFLGCGCDFEPQGSFVQWAKALPEGPTRTAMVWIAKHLKIFGNAGEAIVAQIKHNMRGHGQYLLGAEGHRPFWYYFPTLFAIKLAVPLLIGIVVMMASWPRAFLSNAALTIAAVYFLFSFNCRVQIGIRLQLPGVVFLIVGLSTSLVQLMSEQASYRFQWIPRLTIAASLIWLMVTSVAIWPHGLCYANELWGGASRAYLLASDSNYDWGQGLPELMRWHERSGQVELDVWYFGKDPQLKRLPVRDLPLHCVPIQTFDDVRTFCWGRFLAVGTSVRYGYTLSPAHRIVNEFLNQRAPMARTQTFLIYDLTDLPPPSKSGIQATSFQGQP
jgi:hypothetical protein